MQTFSLIDKGEYHELIKRSFPRLTAMIDLRKQIPEIKDLKFIDDCSVKEMAAAIAEIGIYLQSLNKE